jgi:23S rRNA (cytosine1962-C5)-methyltransferase
MSIIYLKSGREKSLQRHHPWVFSGAIHRIDENPDMGETVEIRDSNGRFLAWGAFSPKSQIRVRVWSWDAKVVIGPELFCQRLKDAITFRKALFLRSKSKIKTSNDVVSIIDRLPLAVRLVNAESDGLPGLIVDRYGNTLVLQFLSAGAERWRQIFVDLLMKLTNFEHIYERSDVEVRGLEGLSSRVGPLRGVPPDQIFIEENNLRFAVDIFEGHKTGFYLDQRYNREIVQNLSKEMDVLDCFSYSGGFSVSALAGGAKSITTVDSSKKALDLLRENLKINALSDERVELIEADVFQQLRKFRDEARQFDLIVLDPPKFAPTASHVQKATRAYKDINLLAFKLLRPGGYLVTFSCSGGIDTGMFQKIVAGAALDAGVSAQIVKHLEQSPDHPVLLSFPESAYLKGLILRVHK